MNIVIDKFGRIVIPKAIRRKLGLEPGTKLRLEVEDREIVLQPVADEAPLVERDGILVSTASLEGASSFDIVERIRAHRADRTHDRGGRP